MAPWFGYRRTVRLDYWTLVRFLHITSAILWVGGQLVISLFLRPVAVRALDPTTRRDLIAAVGARFGRVAGMGLFPLLLATGLALSYQRGVLQGAFGVAGYGPTLAVKVVLAVASFALAVGHGVAASRSSHTLARVVGISGAAVSLVVVLLATSLAG